MNIPSQKRELTEIKVLAFCRRVHPIGQSQILYILVAEEARCGKIEFRKEVQRERPRWLALAVVTFAAVYTIPCCACSSHKVVAESYWLIDAGLQGWIHFYFGNTCFSPES